MKTLLVIIPMLLIHPSVLACSPVAIPDSPPQWINGEWVQAQAVDQKALIKADIDRLKEGHYDYIFSVKFQRVVHFSGQQISYLKTQDVWHGKVPEILEMDQDNMPSPHDCQPMEVGKQYLIFGHQGSRRDPVNIKEFRSLTALTHALLGPPKKRWARGRLIILRD